MTCGVICGPPTQYAGSSAARIARAGRKVLVGELRVCSVGEDPPPRRLDTGARAGREPGPARTARSAGAGACHVRVVPAEDLGEAPPAAKPDLECHGEHAEEVARPRP